MASFIPCCVILRAALWGAGNFPKLLLAKLSLHSPEKLGGAACALAPPSRVAATLSKTRRWIINRVLPGHSTGSCGSCIRRTCIPPDPWGMLQLHSPSEEPPYGSRDFSFGGCRKENFRIRQFHRN